MSPRSDEEYVRELEQAIRRLERTNRELARKHLGTADSAAAAALDRIRNRADAAAPQPGLARRAGSWIRRVLTMIVPHGLVLLRMRLRERNREEG
jgi:hypothetical protein